MTDHDYFQVEYSKLWKQIIGKAKLRLRLSYNICEAIDKYNAKLTDSKHKIDATDDFTSWDMKASYWDKCKEKKLHNNQFTLIIAFGKYAKKGGNGFIVTEFKKENATLYDLYNYTYELLMINKNNIADGFFLTGFNVYSNGNITTDFEA